MTAYKGFSIIAILALSLLFIDKIKITVDDEIRFVSLDSLDGVLWADENSITCYDEGITYMKNKDISIKDFDFKQVGFLWYHRLKFEKGNLCDFEFYITEKDFLSISPLFTIKSIPSFSIVCHLFIMAKSL